MPALAMHRMCAAQQHHPRLMVGCSVLGEQLPQPDR